MREFEIPVHLTIEDYTNYNLTFFSRSSRIFENVIFWLLPSILIIIAIGMLADPKVENKAAVIVVGVFFGLSFLLSKLFVFLHRKLYPAYINAFSKRKYKNSPKDSLFRINENGIESITEMTKFFCVWKQVVNLKENETAIYVFINKYVAFIIPKCCFKSIEELAKFKEFIAQQTGKQFQFIHLNRKKL